jgi:hypothetical protein
MKAVNLFTKRGMLPSLIASLSFFLTFLSGLSLSGQDFSLHPNAVLAQVQEEPSSTPPDIPPPAAQPEEAPQEEPAETEEAPAPEQAQPAPPSAKKLEEPKGIVPGPPIMLSLRQAIQIALSGNRPYLDRIDSIRQRQGLGQSAGTEQLIALAGGGNLSIPVQTPSGVAQAEAQFQTFVSPSFIVSELRTQVYRSNSKQNLIL